MYSLPYFPFEGDHYDMPMNAAALLNGRLIEVDRRYAEEVALRREILARDDDYYCRVPESSLALQWEAVELLLPGMSRHDSEHFHLEAHKDRRIWTNRLLAEITEFAIGDTASLPLPPLDWVGRQVQEDLILMEETPEGESVLAAGQLCFAANWCLADKMGLPFAAIHDPVPLFRERLGRPADLLMRRLKPGRPVWRINWSIAATDRLNLSPATADEWTGSRRAVTPENAGERCFLRLERQTLSRLRRTRGILFTIHTYRAPIAEIADEPEKLRRFTSVIKGMPPEIVAYKGMTEYRDALIHYLESTCRRIGAKVTA